MRKDKITEEDKLQRLKELAGIKLTEEKHNNTFSTINYTRKIGDTTYGVVKEHGSYYIKKTDSDLVTESTLSYIGGLENKNQYKYNSYADALKNLNMIHITINESKSNHINERLEKDIQPEQPQNEMPPAPEQNAAPQVQAPAPEPASEAPMSQGEPEGETSVEQPASEAPAEENPEPPEEDNEFGEKDNEGDSVEHYLGKTTAAIRKIPVEDFSEERIKSIMNTIISSLPLDKLSPEDLLKLARRVKRGGKKDDEADNDSQENAPEQDMKAPNADTPEMGGDELKEEKYPWDKCEKNAENEYGSKKIADKVCGAIKAKHMDESSGMSDYGKAYDTDESDYEYIKQRQERENKNGKKSKSGVAAVIKANNTEKLNESIKGQYNIKDDSKINEMISKINKKELLKEGNKIKYRNVILESDGRNKLIMNNGKNKFEFLVKHATIKKLNEMVGIQKPILSEDEKKVQELIKKVINKTK